MSYPNCLSAQVLPPELRGQAIQRLVKIKDRVADFPIMSKHPILENITKRQIDDNVNYLMARDQSHLWPDFVEFNKKLDATRGQSLLDVMPEFKPYV